MTPVSDGGAEAFGVTDDHETVHRVRIAGGGLTAHVMSWGAVIQDLRLAGHPDPLVLGFDDFDAYPKHSPHFGAIAGRYANRIGHAHFVLDGEHFDTDPNFLGKHTLHGGAGGMGRRVWTIAASDADSVTLTIEDRHGWMGFPGTLSVACTYRLAAPGRLCVELTATTDRPTLCNLAHHSYFNLDDGGAGDCLDHRLAIHAGAYTPVDDELIPTGAVRPVDDTPFDFTVARTIRSNGGAEPLAYDHNFCLAAARGPLRQAAWVQGARSGVEMELWTSEPGLQFYAGGKVARSVPGLGGRSYGAFAGFALEPQIWPDSPNRPWFPQAVLRPGEVYRQLSEYRFRAA